MTAVAQAQYAARQKAADPIGWAERRSAIVRRHRASHRPQHAAHNKVYRAVRNGTLVRPDSCAECGRTCKAEAAHTDYSKPPEVKWLCRKCHAVMDLGRTD